MQVAGLPLSGTVGLKDGKALKVQVKIIEQGLKDKLMEYVRLVVAFFNYFEIKLNSVTAILHFKEEVFNEIKTTSIN